MIDDATLLLPVSELSALIKARKVSPVELTQAYLDRIRRHGRLNAFARVTAEHALLEARRAESEIHAGRWRGPLHGIPYGAKDLLATAGIPTTWGARNLEGQMFKEDATVVRRLRDAGAILLGKLAMVELAGGLGYRSAAASSSGPGRNPWDPTRWTGGSSSGSGAAVAAGLAAFAIGTETWGSILCPSAFCGVTGLRPTYGRVSRAGGMVCSYSYDKIGPIARSATDCRLILQAIAGPDPADPTSSAEPVRLEPRDATPLNRLRGAIVRLDFAKTAGSQPEVGRAFEGAVSALRLLGLKLEEAKLPAVPASEVAGVIITAEALSAFERFYRDGSVRRLVDPYAPLQPQINKGIQGSDLVKAWRVRRAIQEQVTSFFDRYDVIVTPNFMSVAPKVSEDLYQALPYADPAGAIGNTCGLPAIALPCGFGRDRMPAGFQIMGAPFDEATLLALGELYQRQTSFHREHPALAS